MNGVDMTNGCTNSTAAAYDFAKRVYQNKLTQADAARELDSKYGINVNSAKVMITVYVKMIMGVEFERALSDADMNYFMARILAEGGPDSLVNPTSSLSQHIEYYERKYKVTLSLLREIASLYSSVCQGLRSYEDIELDFQYSVGKSIELTSAERKKRLASALKRPKKRIVTISTFDRNYDVVAEVLLRANGVCESCGNEAPFVRKKDNSPYLELHHKERLADGGEDSIENAIAICPNCHRNFHFGKNT